jgi:cell division protein FtsQ
MFAIFKLRKSRTATTVISTVAGIALILGLIAFTEARQGQKTCREVIVKLDKVDGHQFLSRRDVTGYITNEGSDPVVGESFDKLDFRQLEQRLKRHGLVKNCQVSRDLMGNLIVSIEQPRPVARLVSLTGGLQFVEGQYVSEEGRFFPISMNHTVRVPLVSGGYFSRHNTLTDTTSQGLVKLLNLIRNDPFWQAQVAEIEVSEQGAVTLWPVYGKHRMELGMPIHLDLKFKKLKLFYKSILSAKGWDRYSRVNVQYRNQIVCE